MAELTGEYLVLKYPDFAKSIGPAAGSVRQTFAHTPGSLALPMRMDLRLRGAEIAAHATFRRQLYDHFRMHKPPQQFACGY